MVGLLKNLILTSVLILSSSAWAAESYIRVEMTWDKLDQKNQDHFFFYLENPKTQASIRLNYHPIQRREIQQRVSAAQNNVFQKMESLDRFDPQASRALSEIEDLKFVLSQSNLSRFLTLEVSDLVLTLIDQSNRNEAIPTLNVPRR